MSKTLILDDRAVTTVSAMNDHVAALGRAYGEDSPQHAKAASSLARALAGLMLAGFSEQGTVSKDGDLSLFVAEGGYGYALIFHTQHRACTVCRAQLDAGGYVRYQPSDTTGCEPGAHVPDYGYDLPSPGTWSMHS
jgi:hypothetical protein